MPTSWITWVTGGGGNTASGATTLTSGMASALAYANQFQTSTATTSGLAALYNRQNAASVTHWTGLGSATTTGTYWTVDASQAQWYTQEEDVTPQQYLALAHRRVEYTEEQRAQVARAQERHRVLAAEEAERRQRAYEATQEQRRAALARSRELLLQHLTRAQRRTFEENNWFIVQGGHSKKTYCIWTTGYTGNIEELDRSGRLTHRLCGHLRGAYALYDHHVAQKISLECDEEAFVALCNRHAA